DLRVEARQDRYTEFGIEGVDTTVTIGAGAFRAADHVAVLVVDRANILELLRADLTAGRKAERAIRHLEQVAGNIEVVGAEFERGRVRVHARVIIRYPRVFGTERIGVQGFPVDLHAVEGVLVEVVEDRAVVEIDDIVGGVERRSEEHTSELQSR